ncbi:hypothetical protein L665_03725 [Ralstonia solanacearum SD54]|nr:hypothetical protein F504_2561 [Ralstonia pseudosolanacearum FQY_4]ARU20485.1 twitching motility protein PilT [Ralstonia solanacearum]ESS47342.1 hypothetical protein L665_03725 [Ralstonia solanacearum SD54]
MYWKGLLCSDHVFASGRDRAGDGAKKNRQGRWRFSVSVGCLHFCCKCPSPSASGARCQK